MNLQAVLNALSLGDPLSSTDLAKRIAAHPSTVTRLTGVLEEAELIHEMPQAEQSATGTVGRPPKMWALNAVAGYAVGLALTARIGRGVLVDLTGRALAREERTFDPPLRAVAVVDAVRALIGALTGKAESDGILGVGVGITGIVDPQTGRIRVSGGLLDGDNRAAVNYPLGETLEAALPWPVYLGNDANLGALAAFRRLVRRGELGPDGSVYYLLAVDSLWGFGSGIVIGGELYAGSTGAAGETVHPSLASWEPEWGELPAQALKGEPGALRQVTKYLTPVLDHFAALALTLDTSCVVLGGALSTLGEPIVSAFKDALRAAFVYEDLIGQPLVNTIKLDSLWPDTVSLGAADLVLDSLFPVPSLEEPGPLVRRVLDSQAALSAAAEPLRRTYVYSHRGSV
jgi:hypothetical protein